MASQRINQLFDTLDSYSILNWIPLLNFATNNELELIELKQLAKKSEEFRQYWNTPKTTTTKIIVRDGTELIIPKTRNSLEISRTDVVPNIHKLIKEIEQQRREAKAKSKNIKHNIESMPLEVAVV